MDKSIYNIQKTVNFGFDKFDFKKDLKIKLNPVKVNYEELIDELRRLMRMTQNGHTVGDKNHSLFVYGPTGSGKTEIVGQIAKEFDAIYHKLEIQKVPIEEFTGFPYLSDHNSQKVVKLAHPTILPPSNHKGLWLLHLDEFNKADAEKMAAVMNLVLTGEIGGAADYDTKTGKSQKYHLPQRTVIIGSGNFKIQENVENFNLVNSMDIATSERFHRALFLDYNAESWLRSFAVKEYDFKVNGNVHKLSNRISPIIMYFIMDKMLEDGKESPFLIPISIKPDEGGSERTASPRTWTLVSDNILLDGLELFNSIKNQDKYKRISEEIFGDENRAFDIFMKNPEIQIRTLSSQTSEFGLEGEKIVNEIISRYIYFAENRITPDDILFEYANFRDKIKKFQNKPGVLLYLLISVGYYIDNIGELDNIKESAINISTFIEDLSIPAEDITAFIHILDNSKNQIANDMHNILFSISQRYKKAYSGYYYTNEKEIK